MNKPIRKAVRTFLIKENKVVIIKYKTKEQLDYIDIPGGKIEAQETPLEAAQREFKEETGMTVPNLKYIGTAVVEYPKKIFDFTLFLAKDYQGIPQNFEENESMWENVDKILEYDKSFPSIKILENLEEEIHLKIICDENHTIINLKKEC